MSRFETGEFSHAGFSVVAEASTNERVDFIRKTYAHLFMAILAFVGIEFFLFQTLDVRFLVKRMLHGYNFLLVLGLFIGVSFIADKWARSSTSQAMQYTGLILYIFAEAIIFLPLLYIAQAYGGNNVIPVAGMTTLLIFGGLTTIVFVSGKDFSFMGSFLYLASFGALAFIVMSLVFGFSLGNVFSVFMVLLAGGYILYETSEIIHTYQIGQHVAAALSLFASVALLFWYILRIFMSRR